MKTKKWLLVIGLGLVGVFNFAKANEVPPIKCVPPMPTPRAAPPTNPPVTHHQISQNLP